MPAAVQWGSGRRTRTVREVRGSGLRRFLGEGWKVTVAARLGFAGSDAAEATSSGGLEFGVTNTLPAAVLDGSGRRTRTTFVGDAAGSRLLRGFFGDGRKVVVVRPGLPGPTVTTLGHTFRSVAAYDNSAACRGVAAFVFLCAAAATCCLMVAKRSTKFFFSVVYRGSNASRRRMRRRNKNARVPSRRRA